MASENIVLINKAKNQYVKYDCDNSDWSFTNLKEVVDELLRAYDWLEEDIYIAIDHNDGLSDTMDCVGRYDIKTKKIVYCSLEELRFQSALDVFSAKDLRLMLLKKSDPKTKSEKEEKMRLIDEILEPLIKKYNIEKSRIREVLEKKLNDIQPA